VTLPLVLIATVGFMDLSRHAPPPVEVPAAGSWYLDPVFGTRILRVTDADDGTNCTHAYSYWPALNADATRLMVQCDDRHLLYRFDAATLALTPDGTLEGADGPRVQFEGASWAWTSSDFVYAVEGTRLWRIDVARRGREGFTLIHDFAGLFSYSFELWQLHVAGDRVFTFHTRDPGSNAKLDAVVYDADTDQVWVFDRQGYQVDETKIDKLGRIVMVDGSLANPGFRLWDFRAGTVAAFDWNAEDRPGGHVDMGATFIASSDVWSAGLQVRRYDEPRGVASILQYRRENGEPNWSLADHVSLRADDETWAVGSTYLGDGTYEAFEDEIYLARTDGSAFVRLAHTRSTGRSYYTYPRAVIDRTGRFVVYDSDLGSSSRIDVLLLEVPPEYVVGGSGGGSGLDPGGNGAGGAGGGDPTSSTGEDDSPATLISGCAVGRRGGGAAWPFAIALAWLLRRRGSRSRSRRDRTAA
jgi:hypothetical protein